MQRKKVRKGGESTEMKVEKEKTHRGKRDVAQGKEKTLSGKIEKGNRENR